VVTGGFGVVWGFCEGVLIITGHITKDDLWNKQGVD
jgi:hypothetical protein